MFRKTRIDAPVHIQDAHEKVTVVIVYNITGNIANCQDVYFLKMLNGLMIDPLRSS